jgi:hypothetical protein
LSFAVSVFDYVLVGFAPVARRFAIQAGIIRRLSAALAGTSLVRQDQVSDASCVGKLPVEEQFLKRKD